MRSLEERVEQRRQQAEARTPEGAPTQEQIDAENAEKEAETAGATPSKKAKGKAWGGGKKSEE